MRSSTGSSTTPKAIVHRLLETRDRAVAGSDPTRFRATQACDIPRSGVEGYLSLDRLRSKVLAAHRPKGDAERIVAVVEESYWTDGVQSQPRYLLYEVTRISEQWLISNIAWNAPTELAETASSRSAATGRTRSPR